MATGAGTAHQVNDLKSLKDGKEKNHDLCSLKQKYLHDRRRASYRSGASYQSEVSG